jgi:uncharacterized protein YggE
MMTMLRTILATLIVALPAAAVADEIDTRHYIYIEASGIVEAVADLTKISVSLSEKRDTPEDATKAVSEKISEFGAALGKLGLKDSAIETLKFDFSKVYIIAKDKTGKPVDYAADPDRDKFDGYRATYAALITVRSTDKVGAILSSASLLGLEVNAVTFDTSHEDELRQQARDIAAKTARKKAELYAQSLGASLGDLLNVREGSGFDPDTMTYPATEGDGEADLGVLDPATMPMAIAPGKLTFSASVAAKWEIASAKP